MTRSTPSRLAHVAGAAALLVAAALGVRPYLATLGFDPMALDSVYWIVRSSVSSEGWTTWTFAGPHFIAYRPVAALSFSLTSLFVGLEPLAYRIFDVALHVGNGVLVYAVARRLAPQAGIQTGLLAAAIFLGHPIAEEVTPWLERRHNALACCFSLLAIRSALIAAAKPTRVVTGLAAAAWLALALLSNEVAFTTAAALPFLVLAAQPGGDRRHRVRAALPALAAAAVVLVVRLVHLGGIGGYTPVDSGLTRAARVFLAFWRDLLWFDLDGTGRVVAVLSAMLAATMLSVVVLRSRVHLRACTVLLGWLVGASLLLAVQQVWFPRELYALLPIFSLLVALACDAAAGAALPRTLRVLALASVTLYLGLLASAGWQAQPGRMASWRDMQRQLDELSAGIASLPGPGEVLLAIRYTEPFRPHSPLRPRPPRVGPPRAARIPTVWLSAKNAGRGVSVRDAVAFPAHEGAPVRFARIEGRPALLFAPEQPFAVVGEVASSARPEGVALWLDSVPNPGESTRWVFLRDEEPGALLPLDAGRSATTESAAPAAEPAPNVLLIVVDTLRRDHLGAYGYERETSPNIDRLAAEGVRYERALASAPWTTPSVASLLTSRQPAALGITDVDSKLEKSAVLLSERLHERGWKTGAVVSHRFVSERWGFAQGYDFFDDDNALDHEAVTSPAITERAIAFLDSTGDAPFFLLLHYFDPHFAYREHEGFRFPSEGLYTGPAQPGTRFGALLKQQGRLGAADAAELIRRYDSEIRFTDHHIGRVLDHLRERGLLDRTLVVLTADHGEEFLDHGRLGHTKTLYDEVVGVPLIVRRPGADPGVVAEPVALVDVVPTILEAVGLPVPDGLAGVPLAAGRPERFLYTATDRKQPKRAVVAGARKRIHDLRADSYEEYDLVADPQERTPLTGSDPALDAALRAFERRLSEQTTPGASLDLSPEEQERLRLLGYGEDD